MHWHPHHCTVLEKDPFLGFFVVLRWGRVFFCNSSLENWNLCLFLPHTDIYGLFSTTDGDGQMFFSLFCICSQCLNNDNSMVVEVWWFLVSHIFSVILIDFYRQISVKTGVFFHLREIPNGVWKNQDEPAKTYMSNEKKPRLVGFYRGWYNPVLWGL